MPAKNSAHKPGTRRNREDANARRANRQRRLFPAVTGLSLVLLISGCMSSPTPTKPQPTKLSQAQIDAILAEITTDLNADPELHVQSLGFNPGGPFERSVVSGNLEVSNDTDLEAACAAAEKYVWLSPLTVDGLHVVIAVKQHSLESSTRSRYLDCFPNFRDSVVSARLESLYGPRPTDLPTAGSGTTSSPSSTAS